MSAEGADRVAGWATGIGVGLVALMITWLVGNRLAALVWEPPLGPSLAFGASILVGLVFAFVVGKRLAAGSNRPQGAGTRRLQ